MLLYNIRVVVMQCVCLSCLSDNWPSFLGVERVKSNIVSRKFTFLTSPFEVALHTIPLQLMNIQQVRSLYFN